MMNESERGSAAWVEVNRNALRNIHSDCRIRQVFVLVLSVEMYPVGYRQVPRSQDSPHLRLRKSSWNTEVFSRLRVMALGGKKLLLSGLTYQSAELVSWPPASAEAAELMGVLKLPSSSSMEVQVSPEKTIPTSYNGLQ